MKNFLGFLLSLIILQGEIRTPRGFTEIFCQPQRHRTLRENCPSGQRMRLATDNTFRVSGYQKFTILSIIGQLFLNLKKKSCILQNTDKKTGTIHQRTVPVCFLKIYAHLSGILFAKIQVNIYRTGNTIDSPVVGILPHIKLVWEKRLVIILCQPDSILPRQ